MESRVAIQFLAVFLGGGTGAVLRWFLCLKFNTSWPPIQLGTLMANLSGCLVIGLMLSFFIHRPAMPPEIRLFFITGLLGGLTTFSTFSAEVVQSKLFSLWKRANGDWGC